jgi:hypothetical protein
MGTVANKKRLSKKNWAAPFAFKGKCDSIGE